MRSTGLPCSTRSLLNRSRVQGRSEEPLGIITDFLLDTRTWELPFVVIRSENGEASTVLLPTDTLESLNADASVLRIDTRREIMRHSPGVDSANALSAVADHQLVDYPGWEPPNNHIVPVSRILNAPIESPCSRTAVVDDLIAIPVRWAVRDFVIRFGFLFWHRRVVVLPQRIQASPAPDNTVTLALSGVRLTASAEFDERLSQMDGDIKPGQEGRDRT